jgi:hypothetical protein
MRISEKLLQEILDTMEVDSPKATSVRISTLDLYQLLMDLDHLRNQRDELQTRGTEYVEENRRLKAENALLQDKLMHLTARKSL